MSGVAQRFSRISRSGTYSLHLHFDLCNSDDGLHWAIWDRRRYLGEVKRAQLLHTSSRPQLTLVNQDMLLQGQKLNHASGYHYLCCIYGFRFREPLRWWARECSSLYRGNSSIMHIDGSVIPAVAWDVLWGRLVSCSVSLLWQSSQTILRNIQRYHYFLLCRIEYLGFVLFGAKIHELARRQEDCALGPLQYISLPGRQYAIKWITSPRSYL